MVHTFFPTQTRMVRNELSHFTRSGLMPPSCGPRPRGAGTACSLIFGRVTLSAINASPFLPLARFDDEPTFDEPWQAQVLHWLSRSRKRDTLPLWTGQMRL